MKKLISVLFLILILCLSPAFAFKKKKARTSLILSKVNPLFYDSYDTKIQEDRYFQKGKPVYFLIQNPSGFKSDYLKFQIIKHDDNAHIGGYSRIKNQTVRIKNKGYYCDYFVLHEKGKYYLQIFDITDTNHWLNMEGFMIIDE